MNLLGVWQGCQNPFLSPSCFLSILLFTVFLSQPHISHQLWDQPAISCCFGVNHPPPLVLGPASHLLLFGAKLPSSTTFGANLHLSPVLGPTFHLSSIWGQPPSPTCFRGQHTVFRLFRDQLPNTPSCPLVSRHFSPAIPLHIDQNLGVCLGGKVCQQWRRHWPGQRLFGGCNYGWPFHLLLF